MSQTIYQVITFFISILIIPLLAFSKRTRENFSERLGKWNLPEGEYIWFHAASVGEVNGLAGLIRRYKQNHPDVLVLATATSNKGREKLLNLADEVRLLPLDNYLFLQRALKNIKIRQFVFGETELWPSLLDYLFKKNVPLFLVNGRLSEINIKTYLRFRKFFARVLAKLTKIYCIDQESAERFKSFGALEDKIQIIGNLKYDRKPQIPVDKISEIRKQYFAGDSPIIVLGCIRPEEEVFWKDILISNQEQAKWQFIIAPRHPEKFEFFANFLIDNKIDFVRSSEFLPAKTTCVLLDQFGKMEECYAISDLSFIGGSLIPGIGGHSPMEAAAYAKAIIIGQFYENQKDCVDKLVNENAIFICKTQEEILKVLNKPELWPLRGRQAQKVSQSFQGIEEKLYSELF